VVEYVKSWYLRFAIEEVRVEGERVYVGEDVNWEREFLRMLAGKRG